MAASDRRPAARPRVDGRGRQGHGHPARRRWASSSSIYLGASYGTFLGAVYADLFPERGPDGARRRDRPVVTSTADLGQAQGLRGGDCGRTWPRCVDQGVCPARQHGRGGDEGPAHLPHDVDSEPAAGDVTTPGRPADRGLAVVGIGSRSTTSGPGRPSPSPCSDALEGDGTALLPLSDQYVERAPAARYRATSWRSSTRSTASTIPIPPSVTVRRYEQRWRRRASVRPDLHVELAPVRGLAGAGHGRPGEDLRGRGPAHPGDRYDARPGDVLEWAVQLRHQLSGVRDQPRRRPHRVRRRPNKCVDSAVEGSTFGVSGFVPGSDLSC